ncbi:hypothetical protein MKK70_23025 [Methylobacterium sp. E-041]|jgi:hypothetical protein|uniref:hypothetical protein n=1 Tax=unclassified Methylobacterium TaxID=2615210 RepID=UPI001FBA880B|nr:MULTISPECIES: hypothetical protein [unclassified Methylobacterium]MCJ2108186.1 hypothetical protein [Methylobacterium sp. E-041]MCJ2111950.1 hypothetical protein [Methylobacterium sp. E-025]
MPHHTKTLAAALLAAAGLTALPGATTDATAQERITLETIGAVRMARFEEVRGTNAELRPAQAAPARDPAAERAAKAR